MRKLISYFAIAICFAGAVGVAMTSRRYREGSLARRTGGMNVPSSDELRAELERAFNAESNDGAWSPIAVSTLTRMLAKRLPDHAASSKVECHRTICALRIPLRSYEDVQDVGRRMRSMMSDWRGPFVTFSPPRNASSMEWQAFFAKEGSHFPGGVVPPRQ
jgi:hypothetical protein